MTTGNLPGHLTKKSRLKDIKGEFFIKNQRKRKNLRRFYGRINNMKKTVLSVTAFLLGLAVLLFGSLKYKISYAKTEVLTSVSENGAYRLTVYMIGEPDFPFGAAHCRFDLKNGKKTVTKYRFDIYDDGGNASEENFEITWEEDAVLIHTTASEQEDQYYRLFYNGETNTQTSGYPLIKNRRAAKLSFCSSPAVQINHPSIAMNFFSGRAF